MKTEADQEQARQWFFLYRDKAIEFAKAERKPSETDQMQLYGILHTNKVLLCLGGEVAQEINGKEAQLSVVNLGNEEGRIDGTRLQGEIAGMRRVMELFEELLVDDHTRESDAEHESGSGSRPGTEPGNPNPGFATPLGPPHRLSIKHRLHQRLHGLARLHSR